MSRWFRTLGRAPCPEPRISNGRRDTRRALQGPTRQCVCWGALGGQHVEALSVWGGEVLEMALDKVGILQYFTIRGQLRPYLLTLTLR